MFRLEKNQIHIILILLLVAGGAAFAFWGMGNTPDTKVASSVLALEDFSNGWVCSYETNDTKKIEETYGADRKMERAMVTEIVSLPITLPVKAEKTVTMTQTLPDYGQEDIYLIFQTKAEELKVLLDERVLYASGKKDANIASTHIVKIDKEFRNHIVTVKLTSKKEGKLELQSISAGTYLNLLTHGWKEGGFTFAVGVLFLLCGAVIWIPWFLIRNIERQKAVLLYGLLECLSLGVFFVLESRFFQLFTGWNFALYLAKFCVLLIAMILHIVVIYSSTIRKKVLYLTSMGILCYGILFITVMVLAAFSLITVVTAYRIVKIFVFLGILACTVILLIEAYKYKRRECRIFCVANLILLLGICCQMIDFVLHRQGGTAFSIIASAAYLYMMVILVHGLRLSLIRRQKSGTGEELEEQLKERMVEQLNPNLIFASFHTLQSLIKSGSANSIKMIYYISVYLRDNLRAFEYAGEIVGFETELEHVIAYLQLQKTRNQNLNFSIECKEMDFNIPRHVIEPMVENAVKYGIAGNGNKGNVVIRTYKRAEGYAVQVIDDGAGFDKNILKRKSPTALLNLFSLLEDVCQAQVELISKEGKGTVITIVLPMLENDLLKGMEEDE